MPADEGTALFPGLIAEVPSSTSPPAVPVASHPRPAPKPPVPSPLPYSGQLIIGTNKSNPMITVYHDEEHQQFLVYYGVEIIEIVPDDPKLASYKLLLGRLYNTGVKLRSLCETFSLDPKTLRRYGLALKSPPEEMVRILEGRAVARKCTPQVVAFVRMRWPDLIAERSYGAVGRLLGEIKTVFNVNLSPSGLRPLIQGLKKTPPVTGPLTAGVPPAENSEKRESTAGCSEVPSAEATAAELPVIRGVSEDSAPPPPDHNTHPSPFFPKDPAPGNYWCEHAGVLIFASLLAAISKVGGTTQDILAQWLAALWLGAANIEQSKFLHWEDLELILGRGVRYPTQQREKLRELAEEPALIQALFGFNQELLGDAVGTDFYFDPHVKHYTGEQNVLKGWCPKIRFADKVLQSDFIHTARGAPIFFETTDNFSDLRERFFGVVERARTALGWPSERVLTLTVDRGIFGGEVFERVLADPYLHLITWEKGFVAEPWDPARVSGRMVMTRCRNSPTDLRTYSFEYFEQPWKKNPKLRQIVVQATAPNGRTIQVALLTDDGERKAEQIIRLIFCRWLQENDFRYLDQHFGINQITSYRCIEYEKLKGQVEDREVRSGTRKALDQRLHQANRTLSKDLMAEEQALQAHTRRQAQIQELTAKLAPPAEKDTPESRRSRRRLKQLHKLGETYEVARVKRRQTIEEHHQLLARIRAEIETTAATESRLEAMIQADMVKLEPGSKRLMDVLRITARNGFYQALQPFKKSYNNYRDDHGQFRQLTHSPGVLEVSSTEVLIHLFPSGSYGGELQRIVNQTLEAINQQQLEHPKLPGRRLRFRLAQRSELDLRVRIET
jgi:hypothetical protein